MRKKLLLIDAHDGFRGILKDYLNKQDLKLVIFEANSSAMGVIKATCVNPDIVIIDIGLSNKNALDSVREISKAQPGCAVIVLTLFKVSVFKKQTAKIKVKAFIEKNEVYDKLLPLIRDCLVLKPKSPAL